jgi:tryptophan synthase alpha subunit
MLEIGIDGLIIPDLPVAYADEYKAILKIRPNQRY